MTHNKNLTTFDTVEAMKECGYIKLYSLDLKDKISDLYSDINTYLCHLARQSSLSACEQLLDETDLIESSSILQNNIDYISRNNRTLIAALYDEVKNMPSFLQIVTDKYLKLEVGKILSSSSPRVGKDSLGMRIDLNSESKYATNPHQEFPSFPYSMRGVVVWISLTETNLETGGIDLVPKSHINGVIPLTGDWEEETRRLKMGDFQYAQKSSSMSQDCLEKMNFLPIFSQPGDVYLIDFFTVHRTRQSLSNSPPRLTIQARYYDPYEKFLDWKISKNKQLSIKQPLKTMSLLKEFLYE